MQLIRGLHNFARHLGACYATIGTFDGLHLGHQAVLARLQQKASAAGLPTAVILFEPHPLEYFNPTEAPRRLTRLRDKLIRLKALKIDIVVCLRFDKRMAALTAEAFVETVLVKGLRIQHLVVGDDFHFGADRTGDYALLATSGKRAGFSVEPTPSLSYDHSRISSTRVRNAISENDFILAARLLGQPYSLYGRVHHGDKRGRGMGFPTINIPVMKPMVVQGVFAVQVRGINADVLNGVANLGLRPTVNGVRHLLEVYLFDYSDNCYGKNVEVIFCRRLRQEKKFTSLVALQAQIAQDVADAKEYFGKLYERS